MSSVRNVTGLEPAASSTARYSASWSLERGRLWPNLNFQSVRERPDAGAAGIVDMRQVDDQAGIDHQLDLLAVLGHAGLVAQRRILGLAPGAKPHPLGIGGFDFRRGADIDRARGAVDDDGIAGIGDARGVRYFTDRGNTERARHDRDMGIGGGVLQYQSAQPLAVVV